MNLIYFIIYFYTVFISISILSSKTLKCLWIWFTLFTSQTLIYFIYFPDFEMSMNMIYFIIYFYTVFISISILSSQTLKSHPKMKHLWQGKMIEISCSSPLCFSLLDLPKEACILWLQAGDRWGRLITWKLSLLPLLRYWHRWSSCPSGSTCLKFPLPLFWWCCSVTQSCPILQPHGLQHARLPSPSPSPGACSNSCPLVGDAIQPSCLSSVVSFSYLQSSPASGSFQMSQLFTSGGQSIGVSASTSVRPMNTQDLSPSGWTGWISLQSKGFSRVFSNTRIQKH